jgi:HAMP domain-containing protein
VARIMALKKQLDRVNPDLRPRVQGEIEKLEKELNSMKSKSE